jgi:hypothetical protein
VDLGNLRQPAEKGPQLIEFRPGSRVGSQDAVELASLVAGGFSVQDRMHQFK